MDDYKVIRAIGKGSFGKVYLVKHAKENRQYVMKVIKLKGIPPKERCVGCEHSLGRAAACTPARRGVRGAAACGRV